jgi:cytochrome c oxidase subunit 2
MKTMHTIRRLLPEIGIVGAAIAAGGSGAVAVGAWNQPIPQERHILVSARQYAYEPPRLHVNQGDTIHLRLVSRDVIHGFYLEGHDLDAEIQPQQRKFTVRHPESGRPTEEVEEITFVASRRGKYRYRCSHTCGTMHPFMNGELIVDPNTPLHAGVGGIAGLFVGVLLSLSLRRRRPRGEDLVAQGAEA